ncbi:hypothetical protein EDD16DRAFT_728507 [Pisolithus croceorrhizus]|nr:hypothetical protein EV401DRAFT_1959201 [Pisolithus croceorrhizus]KAI6122893.1 hypothetical protein EDD16DRAFT_728507 [Pisolithus croceorrhizus]KAI6168985.1 hypothetical protein EDD17DRAFT_455049 [Pisolithus thermaeus]
MAPSFPKFDRLRAFRAGFRQSPAPHTTEPPSEPLAGSRQPQKTAEPALNAVQSPQRKVVKLFDECAVSCTDSLASDVLLGRDRVVSFSGTSQLTSGDISACSLASLNFARVAFYQSDCHHGNVPGVLASLGSRQTMEEVVSIRAGWSSDIQLDVEDICRAPLFDKAFKPVSTKYELPKPDHFKHVLQELQALDSCAAVIFSCSPETIACFKIQDRPSDKTVFVVFDPRPRRSHPHGAALIFSTSMTQTALTLSRILRTEEYMPSVTCALQPQLLATGHIFVPKRQRLEPQRASTAPPQALRAEVVELKRQTVTLTPEIQRLEAQVEVIRKERLKTEQAAARARELAEQERRFSSATSQATNTIGSPRLPYIKRCIKPKESRHNVNDLPQSPRMRPTSPRLRTSEDLSEEIERALKLKNILDSEDKQARRLPPAPYHNVQYMFRCGICLDDVSKDNVAQVECCTHMICRNCLRDFICTKIEEHRFPISCPICAASGGRQEPAPITRSLVEQIGVTEEHYRVWVEMEMAQFSVLLHCRMCKQSAFVDRQDYDAMQNIVCPVRNCNHVWCKDCQQTVIVGGPKHSCDGSAELDSLVKRKGWRYCPSCKTPIQKVSGCNHLMCIVPGCNTHLCYVCGGLIVRSALRDEVRNAITKHYSKKCLLFEVPGA